MGLIAWKRSRSGTLPPVVESLLASEGDIVSVPGQGRFHMQLGNCVPQLRSPRALEPALCYKRSCCSEKSKHRNQRVAPARLDRTRSQHSNEDPAQTKLTQFIFLSNIPNRHNLLWFLSPLLERFILSFQIFETPFCLKSGSKGSLTVKLYGPDLVTHS